jgi:hypothetical protein
MIGWLRRLLGRDATEGIRAVPGAFVAKQNGRVVYNMLDPTMQQFMGRCVGVVKRAGIRAKGTPQFSVLVGEAGREILLDEFWARYAANGDEAVFADVVKAAQKVCPPTNDSSTDERQK